MYVVNQKVALITVSYKGRKEERKDEKERMGQ